MLYIFYMDTVVSRIVVTLNLGVNYILKVSNYISKAGWGGGSRKECYYDKYGYKCVF